MEEEKNPVGYEQWKQCPIKTIEAYGKEGITHPSKANIDLIGVELDEWDIKYYKEKGVVDIKEIKIWKSLGITADRLYPYMKENISAEICKEWSSRASNHSVCPIKEIVSYREKGIIHISELEAYNNKWKTLEKQGISHDSISSWKKLVKTPEIALLWHKAGLDAYKASQLIKNGFKTPNEYEPYKDIKSKYIANALFKFGIKPDPIIINNMIKSKLLVDEDYYYGKANKDSFIAIYNPVKENCSGLVEDYY